MKITIRSGNVTECYDSEDCAITLSLSDEELKTAIEPVKNTFIFSTNKELTKVHINSFFRKGFRNV